MAATKQNRSDSQTAFRDAFDAMTEWQEEITSVAERHGEKVLTKLSTAAKSVGWPDAVVDASRDQIQLAVKAQAQALDQMTSIWREQLNNSVAHSTANSLGHAMPLQSDPITMPANPGEFWIQLAANWQETWLNAMQAWTNGSRQERC
jgi:hypothetical protein